MRRSSRPLKGAEHQETRLQGHGEVEKSRTRAGEASQQAPMPPPVSQWNKKRGARERYQAAGGNERNTRGSWKQSKSLNKSRVTSAGGQINCSAQRKTTPGPKRIRSRRLGTTQEKRKISVPVTSALSRRGLKKRRKQNARGDERKKPAARPAKRNKGNPLAKKPK